MDYYRWEWMDLEGNWKSFTGFQEMQLESAQMEGAPQAMIDLGTANFEEWTLTYQNKSSCPIRREFVQATKPMETKLTEKKPQERKTVPPTPPKENELSPTDRLCLSIQASPIEAVIKNIMKVKDLNLLSKHGLPPVTYAVLSNRKDVVASLLDRNASVNAKDKEGNTPLYHALTSDDKDDLSDMVRELLAKNADPKLVKVDCKLNPTMEYWMNRAKRKPPQTETKRKLMKDCGVAKLTEVSFSAVGQELAAALVQDYTLTFRSMKKTDNKPLVLMFAGPPGHGKSVLARRYGEEIGRAVQQECRDRSRMPSSA
eukprot:TRINITY_DN26094_c0_g1_i9.p1 TRINITY_DN26094_c0_g1~~TRINITY_DN26094_c0_g1_i9.p1  ORF type:complete len:314 (-),score=55.58 TRINITY_DN26094_c0_g1_i9:16-957(-)